MQVGRTAWVKYNGWSSSNELDMAGQLRSIAFRVYLLRFVVIQMIQDHLLDTLYCGVCRSSLLGYTELFQTNLPVTVVNMLKGVSLMVVIFWYSPYY